MNEARFRQLNEAINEQNEGAAFTEYLCECSRQTCEMHVSLTVEEYELVRKEPTHFVVAGGHAIGEVEVIVRRTERYEVVEKIGVAATVADRLDPRSQHRSPDAPT